MSKEKICWKIDEFWPKLSQKWAAAFFRKYFVWFWKEILCYVVLGCEKLYVANFESKENTWILHLRFFKV